MLTLKKLKISENKLNAILSFIFEAEKPEESDLYKKFIKEDATLEQKLKLLQKEGVKDSFSLIMRLIESKFNECRKCDGIEKIWEKQLHIAECNAEKALSILEVMNNFENDGDIIFSENLDALERFHNKIVIYNEKWGKDVEIHQTGEHAGKTIAQLKNEIKALRGKPGNKEKMGELLFALRAKQNWKKSTGLKK